jgi:hypothetical protein
MKKPIITKRRFSSIPLNPLVSPHQERHEVRDIGRLFKR